MYFDSPPRTPRFFGRLAVRCAFVLAMFGWGTGFYGPPIYLAEVAARTGWPLAMVSTAVTLHFLAGALVAANLPWLHIRLGLAFTTAAGALMTAVGVFGWAIVGHPWQLFAAALLSGTGWVAMGAVAINAIVSRWYSAGRPAALATAYNGASLGGLVFAPLWVALIHAWGFPVAAAVTGTAMFVIVTVMSRRVFSRTIDDFGLSMDGCPAQDVGSAKRQHGELRNAGSARQRQEASANREITTVVVLPGGALWRNRAFQTLAAGMAMGLFAQIGLLAHLFTLFAPILGAQTAGFLMGCCTACAILGRAAAVRLLWRVNDRRIVAAASYLVQALGASLLLMAWGGHGWPVILGVALFGAGIGNATSLPPAIAQADFAAAEVQRVVALIVAIAQASYAFAPAVFGVLLYAGESGHVPDGGRAALLFAGAIIIQIAAAAALIAGRRSVAQVASLRTE